MAKFPDRKSTVKAWCDAAFNFGLTIGPVLGALMYGAGGFFLPFAVTGTAILASGLVVMLVTEVNLICSFMYVNQLSILSLRPAYINQSG